MKLPSLILRHLAGPVAFLRSALMMARTRSGRNPTNKKMFQLSDASGSLTFTEVKPEVKGKYKRAMLKSEDVFIFDAGNEVFAWIGKGASAQEKREAMQRAQDYLKQTGRNTSLPVTKILEGSDNNAFKSFFTG